MLKLVLLYQYIHNTFSKCLKHEKSFYLHLYILIRPPRLLKNRAPLINTWHLCWTPPPPGNSPNCSDFPLTLHWRVINVFGKWRKIKNFDQFSKFSFFYGHALLNDQSSFYEIRSLAIYININAFNWVNRKRWTFKKHFLNIIMLLSEDDSVPKVA